MVEHKHDKGNLEIHNIPISSLVELKWDNWFGDGACWKVHARLWVVAHTRDCDGTPLYSVSRWKDPDFAMPYHAFHGFTEDRLTVVEITEDLIDGYGALEWENDFSPLERMIAGRRRNQL